MEVEQKAPDLSDWGLNYPFTVGWREWVREYRSNFATLPDPQKSIFEQDDALMDDMSTIGALFNHHYRRLKSSGDAPPPDLTNIYE